MARWRLSDAQKHFAEVVEKALTEGPQTIAVAKGKSVVLSSALKMRAKSKKRRRPTMAEVIEAAPRVPEFRIPTRTEFVTPPTFD